MAAAGYFDLRIACVLAVCLLGSGRSALGLGLLDQERFVSNNLGEGADVESFEPFDAQVNAAGQRSSIAIAPDGLGLDITAWGWAAGYYGTFCCLNGLPYEATALGRSFFSIAFRIHGDGELSLQGTLSDGNYLGQPDLAVRVLMDGGVLYEHSTSAGIDPVEFATALGPGVYRLEARAEAFGEDVDPGFDLTFQVRDSAVPVPEPVTALALALGLAGVAASARTRAARAFMTRT
jgi:hypothetical protein